MDQPPHGLNDFVTAIFGGGFTTLLGATVGRLMYHAKEVRAKRRKVFDKDLIWEAPTIFGMALIGEGVASYFELTGATVTATITVLSYMGIKWVEGVIVAVISARGGQK